MSVKKTIHKTHNDTVFKSALLKILVDLDIDIPHNEIPSKNYHIQKEEHTKKNQITKKKQS